MISELLNEAESGFKNSLEEYFSLVFKNINLPSHDLYHHRRVWRYCRELLVSLDKYNIEFQNDIAEKLIIGCYLHDSGMAVDMGDRHGYHSRHFCSKYLEDNNRDVAAFTDLLAVVENHDMKNYLINGKPQDLFTLLSVSDDLDAFGVTGIYRYSEIYLSRGKEIKELGFLVLENIAKRYEHFCSCFSYDSDLINKQRIRYEIVKDFFLQYNLCSANYNFTGKSFSGHCGIVEIIAQTITDKAYTINSMIGKGLKSGDKTIMDFFMDLDSEINS